jgi:hypothetical protein
MKYLSLVCEDEIVGLDGREAALASVLSVLNVVFTSHAEMAAMLLKGTCSLHQSIFRI